MIARRLNYLLACLVLLSVADTGFAQPNRRDSSAPRVKPDSEDSSSSRGNPSKRRGKKRGSSAATPKGESGSKLGGYTEPPPVNNVPPHAFDIILGRLTDRSATVRVLCSDDVQAVLYYRREGESEWAKTNERSLKAGEPFDFAVASLQKDSRYFYRLSYKSPNGQIEQSEEYTFHTQRAPGSSFTFTVQADSHLDENTSSDVYLRTLANALSDRPDFHFELGDAFMTGKYVRPELALPQYLAQRYYLGHLCHSAALYFVLGNHDGELGNRGSNVWATTTRKEYLPNPFPDGFYTGNDGREPGVGLPENYYQWQWGDCQFIVLDPFRHTTTRPRRNETSDGNWYWTLGEPQYQWLKRSLQQSDAKLRFVFLHHLFGGADGEQRGGSEAAPFWEWGGNSAAGKYEFDRYRPGWDKPIHQLLVGHGVSVVFHGHDHIFIKQELDGIVYQLVPQPGHFRFGNTKSAGEYGYLSGEIQSSSGHVRVRVANDTARVDYVRSYLPQSETAGRMNGEVSYSYMIQGNELTPRR